MINQTAEVNTRVIEGLVSDLGFTNFDFRIEGDDLTIELTIEDDSDFRVEKTFDFSREGAKYNLTSFENWDHWEIENAIIDSIHKLIKLYENGKIEPKPN